MGDGVDRASLEALLDQLMVRTGQVVGAVGELATHGLAGQPRAVAASYARALLGELRELRAAIDRVETGLSDLADPPGDDHA